MTRGTQHHLIPLLCHHLGTSDGLSGHKDSSRVQSKGAHVCTYRSSTFGCVYSALAWGTCRMLLALEAEPRATKASLLDPLDQLCWPHLVPKHRHWHCWSCTLLRTCLYGWISSPNKRGKMNRGASPPSAVGSDASGGRTQPLPSLPAPRQGTGPAS